MSPSLLDSGLSGFGLSVHRLSANVAAMEVEGSAALSIRRRATNVGAQSLSHPLGGGHLGTPALDQPAELLDTDADLLSDLVADAFRLGRGVAVVPGLAVSDPFGFR